MKQACGAASKDCADLAQYLIGIYEDGGVFDELVCEWAGLSIDTCLIVTVREQRTPTLEPKDP